MQLKSLELNGFKSFAKKTVLEFSTPITAVVGPNGSGKSNIAESFRFVLGEQSIKSLRGKKGEDLIWNGSKNLARQNRASVKVFFDNHRRLLDVDFDEVSFERVVHRDGVNEYLLNGTEVRLKDIVEILSGAHIGPSGHHIISQGEADRILNANNKERRAMIEDALGLKIYHYKREEAERKLEKARENLKSVESLRREIAPHLKFLIKQTEKLERARTLKEELAKLYRLYFKREKIYLKFHEEKLEKEWRESAADLKQLDAALLIAKKSLEKSLKSDEKSREVISFENKLSELRDKRDSLSRSLGRLEGEIVAEERRRRLEEKKAPEDQLIPWKDVANFLAATVSDLRQAEAESVLEKIKTLVRTVINNLDDFAENRLGGKEAGNVLAEVSATLSALSREKVRLDGELASMEKSEEETLGAYEALRKEIEAERGEERQAEREVFRIQGQQTELRSRLSKIIEEKNRLSLERDEFRRELVEATALSGRVAVDFENEPIPDENGVALSIEAVALESRNIQLARRRELEKIKIRLEELGSAGGGEVLRELKEVEERDRFLAREIEDLEKSASSLTALIEELAIRLDVLFKEGIGKINMEFNRYFSLMFGGGGASLEVVKEIRRGRSDTELEEALDEYSEIPSVGEEKTEREGLEVKVNLLHKRIKGLEMLSGGERALTSIALLFAISQVNPPPFVILDETDAALDESNSRKYGDMIEELSKRSELILITHNRETMSRAGVLYGITMGADAASKILSIKFEEAEAVAK